MKQIHRGISGLVVSFLLLPGRLSAASSTNDAAAVTKVSLGKPGEWVTPRFFDRAGLNFPKDSSEEQRVLLIEREINPQEGATFNHVARQIRSISGVQNGSQISVDFDPSYQSLTFHWMRLWRDGSPLDRLDRDKIKLIQQERDLDQYLYNGENSAVRVLEDVRVGDVIDFAYTIQGANPVFGGKILEAVPLQFPYPVDHMRTRFISPGQRRTFAKNHGTSVQPLISKKTNCTEYSWDLFKVPGISREDSLPRWFDPQPWVQLSEFQTWAEVNLWALTLFQDRAASSTEFAQKLDQWRRLRNREDQVLAALHFVQDEVRYFGIEMGTSSHKPSGSADVFSRRFGDCKDKALLFVTALRALGIEAYPVLVNTDARHTLTDWQPSVLAFNHVIAVVQVDGRTYWLDPTRSYQRGPLSAHYLPDYGRGLVIRPGTKELAQIPQTAAEPTTSVTEYFQVRGRDEPADLKVVTVVTWRDAESLRALFATSSKDVVGKSYLDFYSGYYPHISQTQPVDFYDNADQNTVEVTEYYSINQFWEWTEDRKYRCHISPHTIFSVLQKPRDKNRTLPLGVSYPQHHVFRAEVTLPSAWAGYDRRKSISDPAFYFDRHFTCSGRKITLDCEYRALSDFVPVNRMAGYLENLEETTRVSGYTVEWP